VVGVLRAEAGASWVSARWRPSLSDAALLVLILFSFFWCFLHFLLLSSSPLDRDFLKLSSSRSPRM
jgi:hypothetical protein